MTLEIGDEAPDFALPDQHRQTVRLADLRGRKNVVLVFFPMAFTRVCTGELCTIRDEIADFDSDAVQTLAISCDAGPSLARFAAEEGYSFPLLSDFWPHGEVSRAYDVFDEAAGCPRRSSYVVDREGLVRWAVHNAMAEGRNLDEHLAQLGAVLSV